MKKFKLHRIIICLPFLFLHYATLAQNGIEIKSGGSITVTGSASIEIQNGGLINNGTYTKGNETLNFTGTAPSTISGSTNSVFNDINVSNTGGITTQSALITTNNLTVASGGNFTIDPAKQVTINGTLENNSGSTSGLLLRSTADGSASLLHNSDNVQATIERFVTGSSDLNAMMYHMVSVPLIPATSSFSIVFAGSYLFDFLEGTNSWNGLGASPYTALDETRGYMTYYPLGANTTYSFEGAMNNGSVTPFETLTTGSVNDNTHGWNLVPNPFPSAIDWNAASGWTKTNIDGSIYFWEAGAGNYSTWNGTTGTGTPEGTQIIPSGQSFFVHANGASPVLAMTNEVRVHDAQPFYKSGEMISNLLRIKVTKNNLYNDAVVHFREQATNGFDADFDAYRMQGNANALQISTSDPQGNALSINSLPFSNGDVVIPLNFSYNAAASVTISASGIESFEGSTPIFLEDLTQGRFIDLRINPDYNFTYTPGGTTPRFQLRFTTITATQNLTSKTQGTAFISNGNLFVQVPDMEGQMADISLFNTVGQQLSQEKKVISGVTKIEMPVTTTGIYIVRVNSGKELFTTKIINK